MNEMYEYFNFKNWDGLHENFITEIEQSEDIAKICIKYLFAISYQASYSVSRTRLTGFRNTIKDSSITSEKKEVCLHLMSLPLNINDGLNSDYSKKQKSKLKKIDELPKLNGSLYEKKLDILSQMIKGCVKDKEKGLDLDLIYYRSLLLLFLQMATGRRSIELFKVGNFEKIINNRSKIWFSGQAKTKESGRNKERFIIPVLNKDNDFILLCINELRSTLKTNHLKFSNAKLMNYINGADSHKNHYKNIQKDLKLKNLNGVQEIRSAYALLSERLFNSKMEYRTYIASILGHNENDIETMESYIKHYIPKKNREI